MVTEPDKRLLRREYLTVRSRLTADDVQDAATALAAGALGLPELARARTVAAYVSVGTEPGTRALLDALHARGVRVLLPALLADNDLDWAAYGGEGSLVEVRHGGRMALLEPSGERLGPDAVTGADAVLLPGLAVDDLGMRLGRGGARTTVCWPGWSGRAPIRPWWCCCTTPRSSPVSRPSRTTGRCTRWSRRRECAGSAAVPDGGPLNANRPSMRAWRAGSGQRVLTTVSVTRCRSCRRRPPGP